MNYHDLFLTLSTRIHVSHTIEGCIRPKHASNGDERFHAAIRYTRISIHGYGRLGWGFSVGERLGYGGHNDEVDDFCFLSLFQSSTCPGLVFFLVFSLFGERMDLRLYLCQSQRLVKKFSCVFYFLFLSGLN
jgi:hypothetical protein